MGAPGPLRLGHVRRPSSALIASRSYVIAISNISHLASGSSSLAASARASPARSRQRWASNRLNNLETALSNGGIVIAVPCPARSPLFRSRECSERIAAGRVHRRLLPVGELGTEQGFAPQCPDDAAEDGRQRQQRGKCDDEALVAEVCESGEERKPQYEATQDLPRRELRDCALRSIHHPSPLRRACQAKSSQRTSGPCATVGTVRRGGPDVASWRRCASTNAVKMARGRLSWTASAVSSNSIGTSQWRDNEQIQALSSRMSRRTVHSGSSNSTRRSAASVHAPASLSQRV